MDIFVNYICLVGVVVILCVLVYLMCVCCALYVFVVPYVYLLHCVCIVLLTLDAGLLVRSQYPVLRPATSTQDFLGFPVSTSEC